VTIHTIVTVNYSYETCFKCNEGGVCHTAEYLKNILNDGIRDLEMISLGVYLRRNLPRTLVSIIFPLVLLNGFKARLSYFKRIT
jgi:hypothetical protein